MDIAASAARFVLEVYERGFTVVTSADRRSNALLVRRLQGAFPGVPVVSEESDPASFEGFRRAERVLFVDPVDGTQEFIDRNGEFVVMIGLVTGPDAAAGKEGDRAELCRLPAGELGRLAGRHVFRHAEGSY